MKDPLQDVKDKRNKIKLEWTDLWTNLHKDKVRAEGVSAKDYKILFVESGEILHATRDYKPISYHEILEKNIGSEEVSKVEIDPQVGGWKTFSKKHFPPKKDKINRNGPNIKHDLSQHQRKGGFGWRNKAKKIKKMRENDDKY